MRGIDSAFDKQHIKWKPRDGFLCALALILLSYITNEILWYLYDNIPACADWLKAHSNLTQGALMLVQSSLSLLTVFLFARVRSIQNFFAQAGLINQPTLSGWFSAWVSIGIGFLALYGVTKQWIPPNHISRSFYYQGGAAKWFFIVYAVLIAPFCEEIVRRGFLYRAFRGSYKLPLSIFLILCFHAYFHWGIISHSFYTFGCLVLVEIWLCLIQEWTGNLWNCVLCHTIYNATQNLPWYVYSIGLILYLPYLYHIFCKQREAR
jgi:membrane protease YdiL (CAAX protease family)